MLEATEGPDPHPGLPVVGPSSAQHVVVEGATRVGEKASEASADDGPHLGGRESGAPFGAEDLLVGEVVTDKGGDKAAAYPEEPGGPEEVGGEGHRPEAGDVGDAGGSPELQRQGEERQEGLVAAGPVEEPRSPSRRWEPLHAGLHLPAEEALLTTSGRGCALASLAVQPAPPAAVDRWRRTGEDRAMAPSETVSGETLFSSPRSFVAQPRLSYIAATPAGDRLVAGVARLDEDEGSFVTSIYRLHPEGGSPVRLTRSKEGESGAAFLPDGRLLFLSGRPAGEDGKEEGSGASLFLLPAEGGEPFKVAARPGGIKAVFPARAANTVVVTAAVAPGAASDEEDKQWWQERRKKKVSASLYAGLPVRHWDSYVGPAEDHLFLADLAVGCDGPVELRDLTPDAGSALFETSVALSPDGRLAAAIWRVGLPAGRYRTDLVAIDTSSGERRLLLSYEEGECHLGELSFSPDGSSVVAVRSSRATIDMPEVVDICLVGVATGEVRSIDLGDAPYLHSVTFSADGESLLAATDLEGRAPLFRVALADGAVTRLTREGAFGSVIPLPGGGCFALRAAVDSPPRPVRLSGEPGAEPSYIEVPGEIAPLPGRLEEVATTVADGTTVRAWLVLPAEASASAPAPLALFIHGGPVSSWNNWTWRWNPWLLAARGFAVLLPDPALSTGYGQKMIERGWGQWGGAPFDDLMALTDAAVARSDIDSTRTAALGGSYGGYMANWVAGHTDRFACIVSHASLWSLEQFQATTDWPAFWADEWGYPDTNPELYAKWSPDRFVDAITTPMLVIHGEKDYRCPVGESLRMWAELTRRGVEAKFLWFKDEGHWIMQPGDIVVWYETVISFLEAKLLGKEFEIPSLL